MCLFDPHRLNYGNKTLNLLEYYSEVVPQEVSFLWYRLPRLTTLIKYWPLSLTKLIAKNSTK